jgi:hypothetical protein
LGAIEDLVNSAQEFESTRMKCDQLLVNLLSVDHRDRHSLGAISADIVDACLFVLPAATSRVLQASKVVIGDLRAGKHSSQAIPELGEGVKAARVPAATARSENAQFRLAIKSLYFLIRSFQDAFYRVAYQVLEGKKAKKEASASMKSVLKEGDPVRAMLGEFAAEYEVWFKGWRSIRDRIKLGQGAAVLGSYVPGAPPDDFGINLSQVTPEGGLFTDLSKGTRLSDVTEALVKITKLVTLLSEAARSAS